jgi:hypothetical protein
MGKNRRIKNPVGVGETYGVRREENRSVINTLFIDEGLNSPHIFARFTEKIKQTKVRAAHFA